MTSAFDDLLRGIDSWGAEHAAAAVVGPDAVLASHGDPDRRFWWASVTKPITAWAVLVAVDSGRIDLDEPAGPPGATVRHLLAHTSGLPFDGDGTQGAPGRRRIYSNTGFDVLGELVAERAGESFDLALRRTVLEPLGMTATTLESRPSEGLHGPLRDLATFAGELLRPTLLTAARADEAQAVAFPGLPGVVPGVGNFETCDWGLGLEIHDGKSPHWMGDRLSPRAVGHFGGGGTFLWMDPEIDLAVVALTDRGFGRWALDAWPPFSDAIVDVADYGRTDSAR